MTAVRETVTVGIPTVDRPAAIARCLDAVLAGDVKPDEIIVVDQGRELSARDVVTERMSGTTPLRYMRQSRRGLSAARNLIMDQASHAIVAVTDDDCVPDAAWLAELLSALARSPRPDAVTGRVLALPPRADATFAVSLRTDTQPIDFTSRTTPWRVGTGGNCAVRRELVIQAGGYDERLGAGSPGRAGEDLELLLRLLDHGARIRFEPAAIVRHECQTLARRMATRWDYGHGVGALAGMLCRRGDTYGLAILALWGRGVVRRLVRSAMTRDGNSGIRQSLLRIGGAARGLKYGWRIGKSGQLRRVVNDGACDEFAVRSQV